MLVYGDCETSSDPRELLESLRSGAYAAGGMAAGLPRHETVVALLLSAGELAQGLLDDEFARAGRDGWTPLAEAAGALLRDLGCELCASLDAALARRGPICGIERGLAALAPLNLPSAIRVRAPEGPAFYALYPEQYVLAARKAGALLRGAATLGIRSIGTSLAGAVSAAVGGPPPMTVRPFGHPFAREIALEANALDRLRAAPACAIADEGPGLSGSSFAAAASHLESAGLGGRVHFLPGHEGGPGPSASESIRATWARIPRTVCTFEEAFLGTGPLPRLETWAADATGPLVAPLEDLSAGKWRARVRGGERLVADPQNERRKYLARSASGDFLLKFAGLGARGRAAFERARTLALARWTPEVRALRHGFLVQRWERDAVPLPASDLPRERLVSAVADYLAFRAARFPGGRGASIAELYAMVRRNASVALGADAAESLRRWEPRLASLERDVRRCAVDARLHAWEWLVVPSGALLKADAWDHCDAHDLVGCQDPAWDLAGASVELGLDTEELLRRFGERAGARPPALVEFLRLAYLAFQLGRSSIAAEAVASWAPLDAERLRGEARRYSGLLRSELR